MRFNLIYFIFFIFIQIIYLNKIVKYDNIMNLVIYLSIFNFKFNHLIFICNFFNFGIKIYKY